MAKNPPELMQTGTAVLLRDEDTGAMHWQVNHNGDMDTPRHDAGDVYITCNAKFFSVERLGRRLGNRRFQLWWA